MEVSETVVLKIKRAALFIGGLAFFLFPGQNWLLSTPTVHQLPRVRVTDYSFSLADYPLDFTGALPPYLTARAVAVLDRDSMVMIFSRNEKTPVLPASTVKIMTGLVVLDYYRPNDYLLVDQVNNFGQDMELEPGEIISAKNLLYGVLVASANDATTILARHYPGGERAFVAAMNKKAEELVLRDAYFANPTGLDSNEVGQPLPDLSYTSAWDLGRLAAIAMDNEVFSQIVGTERIVVTDVSGKLKHSLFNINQLLGKIWGLKGVKTGWTEEAGECLVSFVERDGRKVIFVILGSQDRFGETERLIDWVFSNYRWQDITPTI